MIKIDDIIDVLMNNNPDAIPDVLKAYRMAEIAHGNVYRESGEPYITHPLHVAMNIINMEIFDSDTICAALLHDVVEDSDITLEDIAEEINPTVSELVDGVTKMRRLNFSTKEQQVQANTRKIINGLTKDVRIILIKLADRLHNMQTLEFKKPIKQKENAIETIELFVPLALSIGAYQIKSELEDLALSYIEPDAYKRIVDERQALAEREKSYLMEIKIKLSKILSSNDIPNDIFIRTNNIYKIYKKLAKGYKMENIYDLFYLKILVQEVDDCYRALQYVHRNNPPINGRFKDYIFNPRTNHYQSLHTTVTDKQGKIFKAKIKTYDMDKVSAFGIPAYWNISPDKDEYEVPLRKTMEETQDEIRTSLQFAKKLQEIDFAFSSDEEFIAEVKKSLLTEHVYVYNHSGEIIELPVGSTVLDYVCQIHPDLLDKTTGVLVNGKEAPNNRVLRNNDTVQVITKGYLMGDRSNQEKYKIKILSHGDSLI